MDDIIQYAIQYAEEVAELAFEETPGDISIDLIDTLTNIYMSAYREYMEEYAQAEADVVYEMIMQSDDPRWDEDDYFTSREHLADHIRGDEYDKLVNTLIPTVDVYSRIQLKL